jgi:hypothetical protein
MKITTVPITVMARKLCHRSRGLDPFRKLSREIVTNHRAGKIMVNHWKNAGMLSIGKMNPDKRFVGKNPIIMANWSATCCFRVMMEISSPWAR